MRLLGCRGMGEYIPALANDAELRRQAQRALSVSISRFFRDRALWQALGEQVLPMLARAGGSCVKAWSAGCARGEEVYSLRILWEQHRERHSAGGGGCMPLHILGTDLNPEYLAAARAGVYGASSLKEVPPAWRTRYFRARGSQGPYAVAEDLKQGVAWRTHDFTSEPPGQGFQLIFLRNNLLTYYDAEKRERALAKVLKVLAPGGFFVVGAHETTALAKSEALGLLSSPHHPCLWRKADG